VRIASAASSPKGKINNFFLRGKQHFCFLLLLLPARVGWIVCRLKVLLGLKVSLKVIYIQLVCVCASVKTSSSFVSVRLLPFKVPLQLLACLLAATCKSNLI